MTPSDIPPSRWQAARRSSAIAAQAWRRTAGVAALEARFGGDTLADATLATARAIALLTDIGWAQALVAPLMSALLEDPLFEPPLKVAREGGRTGAVLFETAAARVTASVIPPAGDVSGSSVVVPGQIVVTRYVRAGGARLDRWRVPPLDASGRADPRPAMPLTPIMLTDGRIVVQDGRTDAYRLAGASGSVVAIAVLLRAGTVPLVREYDAGDGRLSRMASTDEAASRGAMLRRLLRASGRRDAGDVFAAATHDPVPHLRWEAMREWIALDAAGSAVRLAEMTDDPDAEVRAVAARTLTLVRERSTPCPA